MSDTDIAVMPSPKTITIVDGFRVCEYEPDQAPTLEDYCRDMWRRSAARRYEGAAKPAG